MQQRERERERERATRRQKAKAKMKLLPSSSSSTSSFCKMIRLIVTSALLLSCPTSTSASAAGAAAASSVGQALKNIDYRYFVAGGTCAAISHGITTPIDVVKTRIQAKPRKYKNMGLIDAAINIVKEEGPQTLLQGLAPTIVGYGIEGSMKFGCYEIGKVLFTNLLAKNGDSTQIPPLAFILASITAGGVAAILLCPLESLRIKQVTDKSYSQTSLLGGLAQLVKNDGIFQLFSGLMAMLSKQIPYTFGKQVSFDFIAKILYGILLAEDSELGNSLSSMLSPDIMKWIVSILSAAMASVAACLLSQPGDMILTETYSTGKSSSDDGDGSTKRKKVASAPPVDKSFLPVIHTIYKNGGLFEFFRGTNARIVHVGLIITSQLVIYDIVKQLLGLPATGSH